MTWTRGAVDSASADVTVSVIDRPRVAAVADALIAKAFISNPTDWAALNVPSLAETTDAYRPTGSSAPASDSAYQLRAAMPAGTSTPSRRVATTAPDAFRTRRPSIAR